MSHLIDDTSARFDPPQLMGPQTFATPIRCPGMEFCPFSPSSEQSPLTLLKQLITEEFEFRPAEPLKRFSGQNHVAQRHHIAANKITGSIAPG